MRSLRELREIFVQKIPRPRRDRTLRAAAPVSPLHPSRPPPSDSGQTSERRGRIPATDYARSALVGTVASSIIAFVSAYGPTFSILPPAAAINSNNLLFLEAWRAVDKAYVDKTFNSVAWFKIREATIKKTSMNTTEETYVAIRDMLSLLQDPFTRFLEPEKYASLSESTMSGNITGVGIEMAYGSEDENQNDIVVVAPTPGGPADLAGIRSSDIITAIDGRSVKGLSLYEVADVLQGPTNSEVQLSLTRRVNDGLREVVPEEHVSVTITRQRYSLVPVQSKVCEQVIGSGLRVEYIRLTTFNQLSAAMVRDALQAGIDDDATAFVLDLRSNPGGLFPGAVDIARYFINDGVIVYIADSQGIRDVFEANNDALVPSAPLTLLVDQGTASASEVLAGSLRDNGRARIVGDTTFGKGLIQTLVPLSDGSAVSVTVARYQTPSRMDINKIGIQPDDHLPNVTVESEGRTAELPKNPDMFCEAFASDSALSRRLFPQSR